MMNEPRLSHQTLRVLALLSDRPNESLSGADITRQLNMLSGTVYPILMRLERAGWLKSQWERVDPSDAGRPRKRLYRLTGLGINKTRAAWAELSVPRGRLAWNT